MKFCDILENSTMYSSNLKILLNKMRSTLFVKYFCIVGILILLQSQSYLRAQIPPLPFVSLIDGTDLENYWRVKLEHGCDHNDIDVFYTVRKLDLNNDLDWKVIIYTQNKSSCNLIYSFNFKTLQERNIQSMNGFRQVLDWMSIESGYIRASIGVSKVEFTIHAYLDRGWRIEFGDGLMDWNKTDFRSSNEESVQAIGVIRGNGVRLRSSMDTTTKANIIDKFPKGTRVEILERNGEWLKVRANGKEGYMFAELVNY